MRLAAAILAGAACASIAAAQEDPGRLDLFLGRALETVVKQPAYTCLETVERVRQLPNGRQRVEDTLRLEVALVDGKEMFAWPGSREFEDTEITDLVTTGMFGNGNFGIYARMLFSGTHPPYTYGGTETIDDRTVARYDFRVPRSASGYHLRVDNRRDIAGFHGSFYFDVETLDLRRLEVIAYEIPEHLGLTSAQDRIDYARVPIGEETFLLPVQSDLIMASPGVIDRNHVRFSGCRKFTGESSLVFLDPEMVEAAAKPIPVTEVELPANIELPLVLRTPIDLPTGYAGASIEAELERDLKSGGTVVVPKGALARGRLIRLERHNDGYVVAIRFTDLEWKGGHAKLNLAFDRVAFFRYIARDQATGDILVDRTMRKLDNVLMLWRTRN